MKLDRLTRLILSQNKLNISATSELKWNYEQPYDKPKPDGLFDVEGRNSVDIVVHYKVNLLKLTHWYFLIHDIWYLIKEVCSEIRYILLSIFGAKKDDTLFAELPYIKKTKKISCFKQLLNLPMFIYETVKYSNCFKLNRASWIFTVDSFNSFLLSASYEEAEDLLAKRLGYKNSLDLFIKQGPRPESSEVSTIAKELLTKLTTVQKLLDQEQLKYVSLGLYVNQNDPTTFVASESIYPFSMRDGWDDFDLCTIVKRWYWVMFKKDIVVELHEN